MDSYFSFHFIIIRFIDVSIQDNFISSTGKVARDYDNGIVYDFIFDPAFYLD